MNSIKPRAAGPLSMLGALLLLAGFSAGAAAQSPLGRPAPTDTIRLDTIFQDVQARFELLLPVMERLVRTLREAHPELEAAARADPGDSAALARRAARFTRAYFDALLDEGFTREEALRIVSGGAGRP